MRMRMRSQKMVADPRSAPTAMPEGMRIAGAWAWRSLALIAVGAILIYFVVQLRLLVIPFLIAVVLAALLVPFKNFLMRHRWPKWAAIAVAIMSMIGAIALLIYLIVTQVAAAIPALREQSLSAYENLLEFLAAGPFSISSSDVTQLIETGLTALQENSQALISGVASLGASLGHILTGILLALFATIFLLIDGERIWAWIVKLFPRKARRAVDASGQSGWATLQSYVKVQILVATIDAVGIGAGAALLGVPLALPISVLVFLGSFVPILGALVSGAIAVFIALVYNGWVVALIMLAIVLLVQQVESHILQPLIMGQAVRVHPLAVVLAVTGGSMVAGIAGAFFAVPVVATLNAIVTTIAAGEWRRSAGAAAPLARKRIAPAVGAIHRSDR